MTAAEFQPPPFSQLMPGAVMSYGIPIETKLDAPALAQDLTIKYQSGAGGETHFQSSYRFWVLRELLKPGEFAYIGANHDGAVPDAFDKAALQNILDQINKSVAAQQGEPRLPGLSWLSLVRIREPLDNRRQYLFDFGRPGKARFSIYVGPGKILTTVFVDSSGEPYPMNVGVGDGGVPLGEFVYLACQIGVGDRTTMLRLSVNGKTIQTLNLPFKADLAAALDLTSGIIGADLFNQNGATFDLCEVVGYASTLTELQISKLRPYFLDRPRDRYLEFNGKQWMQRDEKGNMVQPDKALAPRLRQVTPN